MEKLAIIGASYLQLPLIQKAKDMGYETHVFAWAADDVGEKEADVFYPISIIEKDEILETCRRIGICGICSIASDLAMVTVNYVAHHLGLTGNSPRATEQTTNKYAMRQRFFAKGVPSPKSVRVEELDELGADFVYPLIVKPADRSGSRGISKIFSPEELPAAVEAAHRESFSKEVLVEEFAEGTEYSVECISWKGNHTLLAITEKYTTGAPHFVEVGHLQPAPLTQEQVERIRDLTFFTLDSLEFENGASHTELKVSDEEEYTIIEVGGRMGGDTIGSTLVHLTTGVDFIRAVIDVACGRAPQAEVVKRRCYAAVHFILSEKDLNTLKAIYDKHPEYLVEETMFAEITDTNVLDSSQRFGYFILQAKEAADLLPYLRS